VDGLDLIVGALISATVAGLGAVVIAYLGSTVLRGALSTAVAAWAIGAVFIYGSYSLLSGLPQREELLVVTPATVSQAYVDRSLDGEVLRLYDAHGQAVVIDSRKDYYADLVAAVQNSRLYRVLYMRERALLSSDGPLHTVVYDVSVNGVTLESYDRRASQLRLLCSGGAAFGLVMFVGGFLAPRHLGQCMRSRPGPQVSA